MNKRSRIAILAFLSAGVIAVTAASESRGVPDCSPCYNNDEGALEHHFHTTWSQYCVAGQGPPPGAGQCRTGGHADDADSLCHKAVAPGDTPHSQCTIISRIEEEQLLDLLEKKNIDDIIQFLKARPQSVVLNKERDALQVLGCNGLIAVHIPITASIVAALSEE